MSKLKKNEGKYLKLYKKAMLAYQPSLYRHFRQVLEKIISGSELKFSRHFISCHASERTDISIM